MSLISDAPIVEPEYPIIPVANIVVAGQTLRRVGNLYWVERGNQITVTADVALPNCEMMTIIDQVVNSKVVVDELRRPALIVNSKLTLIFTPEATRVHVISAERLNAGLAEIGAQFRVSLPKLEFDVYAPV